MRRTNLLAAALFAATLPVFATADDKPMSRSDADALAAMAMARAKAHQPAIVAQSKAIAYADAAKIAVKQNKPLFVTVRLNCKGVCTELRPHYLTSHEPVLNGDETPRAILAMPADGVLYRAAEWKRLPSKAEVDAEKAKWEAAHHKVTANADPSDASLALAFVATVGLQPGDLVDFGSACPCGNCPCADKSVCANGQCATFTTDAQWPVEYRWVCDGNGCRQVPIGYAAMPAAGGPVTYYPQAPAAADADGQFRARFPRLANLRSRFRERCGFQPPRVAGTWAQAAPRNPQALAAQAPANAQASATRGLFERHPLTRLVAAHYLAKLAADLKITPEQAAAIKFIQTNPQAFDQFVRGMPNAASGGKGTPIEASGNVLDFVKWLLTAAFNNREAILQFIMEIVKIFHSQIWHQPANWTSIDAQAPAYSLAA